MSAADTFLNARLGVVDKPVHRLGLSFNFGIEATAVEEALERSAVRRNVEH